VRNGKNAIIKVRKREKFIIRQPPMGGKDDYDSENSWISDGQMGSPAAAEGGGGVMGGGRGESGERSEVQARSTLTSTAPQARSRSTEIATLDEAPRILERVSLKKPSLALSSLTWVITALARTLACPSKTAAFACTLASSLTLSKPEKG